MKRLIWFGYALLMLGLVAAAGLLALIAAPPFELEVTGLEGRLSRAVGDRTGLEVTADGPLYLTLGSEIGLRGDEVRVRNPMVARDPVLLTARSLAFRVGTRSLLGGRVEPRALDLDGASLSFRRDAVGSSNWPAGPAGRGPATGALLAGLDSLELRVRDTEVDYRDAAMSAPIQAQIRSARLEPRGTALEVQVDASVNGQPFQVEGTTAALSRILGATEPLPIDLKGRLLGLDLAAEGRVADPFAGGDLNASVSVKGESLAGLSPWLGADAEGLGPVAVTAGLRGGPAAFSVAPFDLTLGKGRATGSLEVSLEGKRPRADLMLEAAELDLIPQLANAYGRRQAAQGPGRRIYSDEPIGLDWMGTFDGRARVKLKSAPNPYVPLGDLVVDAVLENGRLGLEASGRTDGRTARLNAELNSVGEPTLKIDLRAEKLAIAPLIASTRASGMVRGELDLGAELTTVVRSERSAAESLSGSVVALVEDAQADVAGLDRIVGGAAALLGQLVTPGARLAKVNCGTVALDFRRGRTAVKAVVDTPNSLVVAVGDLDLVSATLDVRVDPTPKGVTLSVATPVVVSGPIASPSYRIEKAGLLLTLADLAAKVAVPQLMLVQALGDIAVRNDCVQIATGNVPYGLGHKSSQIVKGAARAGTDAVLQGTGAVVEGVGNVLKGAGDAVRGILGGDTPAAGGTSPSRSRR